MFPLLQSIARSSPTRTSAAVYCLIRSTTAATKVPRHAQALQRCLTTANSSSSSKTGVITLSDLDAVDKFTQLNSKCCIYYTATWCGPCQAVKPAYEELSKTYHGAIALGKVDVDDNSDAAAAARIASVPTFSFYHNNAVVKTFSGADQSQLRTTLSELAAAK